MIMSRRNWRTGIATEAGNALLHDAWDRIDGDEIHALVHPDNTAGAPLMRKLGFRNLEDALLRGEALTVWQTQRLS